MNNYLIIDTNSVARRVYEAGGHETGRSKPEDVVRCMLGALRNLMAKFDGYRVALAVDASRDTLLKKRFFPEYKASRKLAPALFVEALDETVRVLQKYGVGVLAKPGYEADDLAYSAGSLIVEKGHRAVLSSHDKDCYAAIACGCEVYDWVLDTWITEEFLTTKFGVSSSQLHGFLALCGDSTDDIPGVPRIGVKTAARLLQLYGTVPAVLAAAAAGEINGANGKALVEHAALAEMSLLLTTPELTRDLKGMCPVAAFDNRAFAHDFGK